MAYSLYTRLRWMIQPYYQPRPPKTKQEKPAPEEKIQVPADATSEATPAPAADEPPVAAEADQATAPSEATGSDATTEAEIIDEDEEEEIPAVAPGITLPPKMWSSINSFYIHDLDEPLGEVWSDDALPAPQQAWFHHDRSVHELFSHLIPGAAKMYSGRRLSSRNRLHPVIKPTYKDQTPYDRTHLLPFGYHGVESDPRLLIGWDRQMNQGPMRLFEERQKKRRKPIYWLARITRTPFGAIWYYGVWDAATMELLDEATWEMKDTVFDWKDEMDE